MTNLVFSFDSEDFTSSYAADGILEAAEILREEGIRGCFCMVGLLARQLLAWGRHDVLEALKHHEIDFHTYGHTLHPTICEYTNTEDFAAAYAEVMRQESEGIALVKAATGVDRVYAAVPPGDDKSYAAMYAYADMGLPCYADTFADHPDGRGVFFCNLLHFGYVRSWEHICRNHLSADRAFFDELAARKTAVIYNHPNRLRYDDFWDSVNYRGGNHYPFGQWKEAPRTDLETVKANAAEIRALVKNLKADGRFTFKTYAELAAERSGARILKPTDIPAIRASLNENFYPLSAPVSLSISDVFAAALAFLRGDRAFAAGRVYGFTIRPMRLPRPSPFRPQTCARRPPQSIRRPSCPRRSPSATRCSAPPISSTRCWTFCAARKRSRFRRARRTSTSPISRWSKIRRSSLGRCIRRNSPPNGI